MRKSPLYFVVAVTLGATAAGLLIAELSYRAYGQAVGIEPLVLINAVVTACALAPVFAYHWVKEVAELQRSGAELEHLAWTDHLTGVPNRRAFFAFADAALGRTGLTNRALLLIDLDNFKSINDTFGHEAGDAALVCVARTIRTVIEGGSGGRSTKVARVGGEEFAVLVEYETSDDVLNMAEMVRAGVKGSTVTLGGGRLSTTVSIGVAFCIPGTTTDAALRIADQALYRAKQEGRDRCCSSAQGGVRHVTRELRSAIVRAKPGRAA